jgi:N-acetylglucosaminyl-diphospho-decaprenol L-rhamnosyltransferase
VPPPPLRVYIPSVDGGPMLIETLRTLAAQTLRAECVVIDNGSCDGSIARVEREFPEVRLVKLESNIGFGPALNEGVRQHPADVLVFANNDVLYEPRFLECLVDAAEGGDVTAAGVLRAANDPTTIDSAGVVVDKTLLAFDHLHGEAVEAAMVASPPLGPTGAAALVPWSAFRAVGGFDGRFFAYLEDVDLALRLRAIGVSCRLAGQARGTHRHSATLGSGSPEKNRLMGWSRGYMLRRYGILGDPRLAARALVAEAVICAGQLAVDRTTSGVVGRLHGWRAGGNLARRAVPPGATAELPFTEALRRRAARRRLPRSHQQAAVDRTASH